MLFPLEALDIHELWLGVVSCPPLEFGKVSCLRNRGEEENFYVGGAAKPFDWINLAQIFLQPSSPNFFFFGSGCLCRKDLKLKTLPQFVKLQSLLLEIQGNNTLFVDLLKPKQIPFILLSVLICMTGGRKRVYRHAESDRRAQGGERKAAQQLSGSRVSDLVHRANC